MSTASIAAAATIVASPSIAMTHTVPGIADTGDGAARLATERLARAEQMIEALRTRYICRDWKFDEDAGERLLRFFRSAVRFPKSHEAQPGYEDEWTFVIRFVGDHGQSLDWLISGDVCGLICGAASRSSVAAIPAASTTQVDAELIRLGAQFDRLRDVHTELNAEELRLAAPMHERLDAVRHDRAAFEAAWEDEKKKGTPPELQEVTARLDELWTSLDPLLDIIMKARPGSFSGVAVKLRAMRWFWDIEDDGAGADRDLEHRWFNTIDHDVRGLAAAETALQSGIESESNNDPIFAAIENHRNAILDLYELVHSDHNDDEAFQEQQSSAHARMDEQAIALTSIKPTTMGGVISLLTYINEVNTGGVKYGRDHDSYSEEEFWPCELIDDGVRNPRGRVIELPFPYWVMENVRAAISEIHATA